MKNVFSGLFGRTAEAASWAHVPTMLKPAELDALHTAARDEVNGAGAIVDLGTWLGGSTVALLSGLERNTHTQAATSVVHAYDKFELNPYLKEHYPLPALKDIPVGGSFLPVFERNVAPWATRLRVHAGDLNAHGWQGGPIELLHVDIMKTWPLANAVVRHFFGSLIPGRSLVFHQDFVHHHTVWIHLLMHRMRACFEPVRHISGTSTMIFRCTANVPDEALHRAYAFADFDPAEAAAAFAWSRTLVDRSTHHQFNIDAAEAMLHVHTGDKSRALELLEAGERLEAAFHQEHPDQKGRSELVKVRQAVGRME